MIRWLCIGLVSIASRLDYDVAANRTFVVVAVDRGQPPLSSTATVIVLLTNRNNYPPVFDPVPSHCSTTSLMLKWYGSSCETHLRATERHLPYGITQCYLTPDTGERASP